MGRLTSKPLLTDLRLLFAHLCLVIASSLLLGCLPEELPVETKTSGLPLRVFPEVTSLAGGTSLQFFGINGVPPYTFSVDSGLGEIDPATGVFVSGEERGTTVIRLVDSNRDVALGLIFTVPPLVLTPDTLTITRTGTQGFSATGGEPPYRYEVLIGEGSIDSTGLYEAPDLPGSAVIRVSDNNGFVADAVVTIVDRPLINPLSMSLGTQGTLQFTVAGGVEPYTYRIFSGGGTVDPITGVLTAPETPGTVIAEVADRYGFVSQSTISVFNLRLLASGDDFACSFAVNENRMKCWGRNDRGQLGIGSNVNIGLNSDFTGISMPSVNIGNSGSTVVTDLTAGEKFACGLLSTGIIRCWGDNTYGQLGQQNNLTTRGAVGDESGEVSGSMTATSVLSFVNSSSFPVQISAGGRHACVRVSVNSQGRVKCWGSNSDGQLGRGDSIAQVGDLAGQMGGSLASVNLGDGADVTWVSAGDRHTCVVLDGGRVKCWGDNTKAQLGLGSTVANKGLGTGDMGANLPYVNLGGRLALEVHAGHNHSCALLDTREVVCWGDHSKGQLGRPMAMGPSLILGDDPSEMGLNLRAFDFGVITSNLGSMLQFPVTLLSVRGDKTCMASRFGALHCWGDNTDGALGLELSSSEVFLDAVNSGASLPRVDVGAGRSVRRLSTGLNHTCTVLDDNSVRCFGNNSFGQLGLGDVIPRVGDAPGTMGLNLGRVDL